MFIVAFLILLLLISLIVAFWQASLIYAQLLGAPSVNSSYEAVETALKLANLKAGETVVDLGCGNGSTLILAAKKFQAKGVGVERSPFYYLLSKLNVLKNGQAKNIKIYFGDFKKIEKNIQTADVVYLYLLEPVLAKIEPWLFANIKTNARIVSLAFVFQDHQPVKNSSAITLGKKTQINLYRKVS